MIHIVYNHVLKKIEENSKSIFSPRVSKENQRDFGIYREFTNQLLTMRACFLSQWLSEFKQ